MSLDSILGIAGSGLAATSQQLALVSHNVANAGTAGYAEETSANADITSGGVGYGVRSGPATAAADAALQSVLNAQGGAVAGQQVLSTALTAVAGGRRAGAGPPPSFVSAPTRVPSSPIRAPPASACAPAPAAPGQGHGRA